MKRKNIQCFIDVNKLISKINDPDLVISLQVTQTTHT